MPSNDRLYLIVVASLSLIMIAVVLVLLAGLFHPAVDNDKIFAIVGPAFQMIVGAFVGVVGGRAMNKKDAP